MKKVVLPGVVCVLCLLLWACKKDLNWDDVIPVNPTTKNDAALSYWSFKGNGASYSGCIDTAYYSKIDSVIVLTIGLSDSAGNTLRISLNDAKGIFSKGSYSTSSGNASIVALTTSGNYTTTNITTGFSIEVTAINDTLIEGIFAASLINPSNNSKLNISDGKLRAIIGKGNRCSPAVADSVAVFTLQSTGNSCSNATVQGGYTTGSPLTASNSVILQVNVSSRGTYNVSTAEVNGMIFSGSGSFAAKGIQTITLYGSGTPLVNGTDSIPVTAGSTNCKFGVTVNTASGFPNAIFNAAGNLCDSATVTGLYSVGSPLNSTNRVNLKLNVSSPGSYAITTSTVNGITFSGQGAFASTGVQSITLTGSGTPTTNGMNKIPISIRAVSCSLNVKVDTASVTIPIPVNSWVFNEGSNVYAGPVNVSSFGGDIITGRSLHMLGNTLTGTDTTFQLYIQFPSTATNPEPGTYQTDPSTFSNNTTDFNLKKGDVFSTNNIYYTKTPAGTGSPVMLSINILSYDAAKKIVQGTFTGTAWNKAGTIVNISNGMFKAEVR